ncbi:hypothetical protein N7481_009678 [Penicillium waksmanii]|uniref:uncharacterized protein n=1 Tax=Penicillium waksmanii TaxID=69791 RepID=UPI0025475456|nr:uncharacterized protein N7481_009678 [Penicillium waksmanii]KAJ5975971.1 hypothetical protein N7481_009678 [Penicillium waksmanii]
MQEWLLKLGEKSDSRTTGLGSSERGESPMRTENPGKQITCVSLLLFKGPAGHGLNLGKAP